MRSLPVLLVFVAASCAAREEPVPHRHVPVESPLYMSDDPETSNRAVSEYLRTTNVCFLGPASARYRRDLDEVEDLLGLGLRRLALDALDDVSEALRWSPEDVRALEERAANDRARASR